MDLVADKPLARLTFAQFEAFRHARPKMEKWELIDGELIMLPPPALVHQRISGNIDRLLTAQFELVRPDWRADRDIGEIGRLRALYRSTPLEPK